MNPTEKFEKAIHSALEYSENQLETAIGRLNNIGYHFDSHDLSQIAKWKERHSLWEDVIDDSKLEEIPLEESARRTLKKTRSQIERFEIFASSDPFVIAWNNETFKVLKSFAKALDHYLEQLDEDRNKENED